MSAAPVATPHIVFDDRGVPWIDETNVKVIEVALDSIAHGLSPEEICLEHYRNLSLAQIHAALGYYFDHQQEMDAEIDRQLQNVEALRAQSGDSDLVNRLRSRGRQT